MPKDKLAFCRIQYASADGSEVEWIWNSRDRPVTDEVSSAVTGERLFRAPLGTEVLAIDYVPKVGERIFVDLTEQRARIIAAEVVEHQERNPSPGAIPIQHAFNTRAEAVDVMFQRIWEHRFEGVDILVVTAGYVEELKAKRAQQGAAMLEAPRVPVMRISLGNIESADEAVAYDRQGKPIYDLRELEPLFRDMTYKIVARTPVEPNLVVSTVWLGIDHRFVGPGAPLIFETMVYEQDAKGEAKRFLDEQERYSTQAEAIEGHKAMVAKYTS